jgi:hypothetical protein
MGLGAHEAGERGEEGANASVKGEGAKCPMRIKDREGWKLICKEARS